MYLLGADVRADLRTGAMGVTGRLVTGAMRQHNPCVPKPLKQLVVTTG